MIIDGKIIAETILKNLEQRLKVLSFRPLLCDVLVGTDSVAESYVNIKRKTSERIGLRFEVVHLPESISQADLLNQIAKIQNKPELAGLIVQLPLPTGINKQTVLDAIKPEFDVDCLGRINSQLFYGGKSNIAPPTAAAVRAILQSLPIDLSNKQILVIGQGELVGKPVTFLLKQQGLKVLIADSSTANLANLTKSADVIISGTGQPGLITGQQIKPGATVIDAGTSESGGGIVGDVDFASVEPVAAYVSPVPGGVGPVTVAKLLENVVAVAESKS